MNNRRVCDEQIDQYRFWQYGECAKIVAIISPDSAPSKRIVQNAKDEGRAIDATQGRRTRAVIIMTDDHVVLSALQPETIAGRYQGRDIQEQLTDIEKDEEDE